MFVCLTVGQKRGKKSFCLQRLVEFFVRHASDSPYAVESESRVTDRSNGWKENTCVGFLLKRNLLLYLYLCVVKTLIFAFLLKKKEKPIKKQISQTESLNYTGITFSLG